MGSSAQRLPEVLGKLIAESRPLKACGEAALCYQTRESSRCAKILGFAISDQRSAISRLTSGTSGSLKDIHDAQPANLSQSGS
jgi:hypothetical protein